MKFLTNDSKQPLLQTNSGVVNLNTLEEYTKTDFFPVKAGKEIFISKHKNNGDFLNKASKIISVSKVTKTYGKGYYLLDSKIICVLDGPDLRLIGNYPIYYLKLLYRYLTTL